MKRILIVFGGCSTEHEVSCQSARAVVDSLRRERYVPVIVGITRAGRWLYCGDEPDWDRWRERGTPCTLSLDRGAGRLLLEGGGAVDFDAAFPILHGKNGEDGTVQGLIELIGVPLIGCGALCSALCMDKGRAHQLVRLAGIQVPRGGVFRRGDGPEEMAALARALGYPVFVKPVRAGSSFGVSRVTRENDLIAAVEEAFCHDREVMIEEAVPGFEVGCAVLGDGELTVGAVDEIELAGGFFDYEEKYHLTTAAIHCPARIAPEQAAAIQQAARRIYRALDCRGFARVDLFLTPRGEIVFNEVNTIPGFTSHSRYPNMMRAIGLDFAQLVERIIETGVGE